MLPYSTVFWNGRNHRKSLVQLFENYVFRASRMYPMCCGAGRTLDLLWKPEQCSGYLPHIQGLGQDF